MKPVTLISALLLVFVVTWFAYDYFARRTSCEAVFEQSAPSLKTSLGFIDAKGEVTIGRQQVQALGESSQKLGLTLRNCCIAHRSGTIGDGEYRACIGGAKNYEAKVRDVKNDIEQSQAAAGKRDTERAAQYAARAKRVVEVAIGAVEVLPVPLPSSIVPPSSLPTAAAPPSAAPSALSPITGAVLRVDAAVGGGPRSPADSDAATGRGRDTPDAGHGSNHDAGREREAGP